MIYTKKSNITQIDFLRKEKYYFLIVATFLVMLLSTDMVTLKNEIFKNKDNLIFCKISDKNFIIKRSVISGA